MLTAANGKSMKGIDVFSAAISFMKEHLIENVNKSKISRGEPTY